MNIKNHLIVTSIIASSTIYCMEQEGAGDQPLIIYALPGLGGRGSEEPYVRTLFEGYNYQIKNIVTPKEDSDLGQEKCIEFLYGSLPKKNKALQNDQKNNDTKTKKLVHASSQAVAGMWGALSRPIDTDCDPIDVDCIIGEGPYKNANDAVVRSLHGDRAGYYSMLRWIPYPKIWAPHLVRLLKFPDYSPAGTQPLLLLSKTSKDFMPLVIIIRGTKDQRVEPEDGLELYRALRYAGNHKTYLITKQGGDHIHLLEKEDIPALHAILEANNILPAKKNTDGGADAGKIDIKQFQPEMDFTRYLALCQTIKAQQRMHERIEMALNATKIVAGAAAAYWGLKKLVHSYRADGFLCDGAELIQSIQDATPGAQFMLSNLLAQIE